MSRNNRGSGGRLGHTARLDAAFYSYHVPHLQTRLLRTGLVGADVDDLVQHTFVVAHANWGQRPRGRRKQRNWLDGIAWRLAMNLQRSHQRRQEQPDSELLDTLVGDEPDFDNLIHTRHLFMVAIAELLDEEREMLFEYYVDDLPLTEIAARHGLARSTAWSRLQKLRRDIAAKASRLRSQ